MSSVSSSSQDQKIPSYGSVDPWDAFGSDDDENDDDQKATGDNETDDCRQEQESSGNDNDNGDPSLVAQRVVRLLLSEQPHLNTSLAQRRVSLVMRTTETTKNQKNGGNGGGGNAAMHSWMQLLRNALQRRGIRQVEILEDVTMDSNSKQDASSSSVRPGLLLLWDALLLVDNTCSNNSSGDNVSDDNGNDNELSRILCDHQNGYHHHHHHHHHHDDDDDVWDAYYRSLVAGGLLILVKNTTAETTTNTTDTTTLTPQEISKTSNNSNNESSFSSYDFFSNYSKSNFSRNNHAKWCKFQIEREHQEDNNMGHNHLQPAGVVVLAVLTKRLCRIQSETCPWLLSQTKKQQQRLLSRELERVASATVPLSVHEIVGGSSSACNSTISIQPQQQSQSQSQQSTQQQHPHQHQQWCSQLSERSIEKAVAALLRHGYCILPHLLDVATCRKMGQVALEDLHEAAERLLKLGTTTTTNINNDNNDQEQEDKVVVDDTTNNKKDNNTMMTMSGGGCSVDLYHPLESVQEPAAYRELSLREDLRVDLRNGPRLDHLRRQKEHCYGNIVDGNDTWIVRADTPLRARVQRQESNRESSTNNNHHINNSSSSNSSNNLQTPFFRGHPDLLEIVRRCMNPTSPSAAAANWGRYNFNASANGGEKKKNGPGGTFQDLRVSRIGALISLPGSADQALHADTPHLFEDSLHHHLPPHYMNAFAPTVNSSHGVGQTALIHGSHRLDAAARLLSIATTKDDPQDDDQEKVSNTISDSNDTSPLWHGSVARPRLEPGDVLLFDCRILHFGLANTSSNHTAGDACQNHNNSDDNIGGGGAGGVERPILYTNMTHSWFTDPKNWDKHQRIFPEL